MVAVVSAMISVYSVYTMETVSTMVAELSTMVVEYYTIVAIVSTMQCNGSSVFNGNISKTVCPILPSELVWKKTRPKKGTLFIDVNLAVVSTLVAVSEYLQCLLY